MVYVRTTTAIGPLAPRVQVGQADNVISASCEKYLRGTVFYVTGDTGHLSRHVYLQRIVARTAHGVVFRQQRFAFAFVDYRAHHI